MHELAIERGGVRGREVGREDDAGLHHGSSRCAPIDELGDNLARHPCEVRSPSAQVLVIEAAVLGGNRLGSVVPGLGGVPVLFEDRAPGGLEKRGVIEEEDVGVEDRGAVFTRACGDRVAGGRDVGSDRSSARSSASHSACGSLAGSVGTSGGAPRK